MQEYCLYASDVAAFIGENQYKTADTVYVDIWKRTFPTMYTACHEQAEAAAGKTLRSLQEQATIDIADADTRRRMVAHQSLCAAIPHVAPALLSTTVKRHLADDPLFDTLSPAEKRRRVDEGTQATTRAAAAIVDEVLTEAKVSPTLVSAARSILLDSIPAVAIAKLAAIGVDAPLAQGVSARLTTVVTIPVPTIGESIAAAAVQDVPPTAAVCGALSDILGVRAVQDARSAIQAASGTRLEAGSIHRAGLVTGRPVTLSRQAYRKRIPCGEGCRVVIYGKVDGLRGDTEVVEAKQRQNHLFGRVLERERVQVYVYLFLTDRTCGTLLETYRAEQREYAVPFDPEKWAGYRGRIQSGIVALHAILHDVEARIALLRRVLQ